ncbi:hypothetical protein GCM10011504_38960 [Siccirubricoccus deserti]|nr:hypothetical protein GCM10011504_38960 [Siccirubricoccus deserti]
MQHRLHPLAVQPLGALHGEHHAGLGIATVAREGLPPRQHQMDPGRAHPGQAANGAGQFAFHGAQPVHVLLKGAGGEGLVAVENLPADAASGGQPLPRQQQPEARHLVHRGQQLGAAAGQSVGHPQAFQRGDHGRGVARFQLAEQWGHGWVAGPQRQRRQQPEQPDADDGECQQALWPERPQPGENPSHHATSCGRARPCIGCVSRPLLRSLPPVLHRPGRTCRNGI